ncbi:MAG: transketolase [Candidatus Kerfeldbacteria bacterium RIFCSPHIGHO2_02_FULL_42_14]|uniref:Transketolase n=1 Tax=Candidatus Kerfeldbacteria bacterium RIFCSPHIGHO2_02_FULL_42_14 TaxID=1798540 RepID=A0A1G2ATF6_9BACT|nr:MAG: transketolase [Candidatus Kerfeldbacteria bacterium RIFCSPHIGHO2_02_FULL_42_14]OGY81296.1 MAG: transketolase [Candidatus Kerfeldbacteria bacterium RIFCSPHIGHO2_12_FULL_42_13]OGY83571.1 MAG: transketolase [Candidatus Kerfeldbacteria bacterium RIFCSPLOWO2_02_FULL_42_19]OGY86713.1 MAG: transketolase [Candidatus Kerfeldbacteria bacterium RIFCSPLOWO2_12_FULL_43_9]
MLQKIVQIDKLERLANTIRQDVMRMLVAAGSGHSAGPLGMADVFTALYFTILNHDPKRPNWPDRDRLYLCCGHICPVRYAAMLRAGYGPVSEGKTLRKLGSRLQGHPALHHWDAVESSSGPLGQGISIAVGAALAAKLDHKKHFVFCVMSDGELQEGQVWEAYMFAGKHKLGNLVTIIDRNNIQIDGFTEEVMPLEPLADKFRAFNWHVLEIDGNNMEQILDACNLGKTIYEKPTVIIAHTVPGKGVDFMEADFAWHGKPPKPDEARVALRELRTLRGRIQPE